MARCDEVPAVNYTGKLTLEKAVANSEVIVVAEYRGFTNSPSILFYSPPAAKYRVLHFLKGEKLAERIKVSYEFHDKTNKPKPIGWKFSKSLVPEIGSRWFLFIPFPVLMVGRYETYFGSFGRLEYTKENLIKLHRYLPDKAWGADFRNYFKTNEIDVNISYKQFSYLEHQCYMDKNWDELEMLYEKAGRELFKNNPERIDQKISELLYRLGRYKEAKAVMYKHFDKIKKDSVRLEKTKKKRMKLNKQLRKQGRAPFFWCGHSALNRARRVEFMNKLDKKYPWLYPWQVNQILKQRDLKFGRVDEGKQRN